MIPQDFKSYFADLTEESKRLLIDELLELSESNRDFAKGEERSPLSCPRCKSVEYRPNGYLKGVRRYCCRACGKYYSETTNKFWYNIKKKSKLKFYLYHMLQGHSIRRCARDCNISIQTSFDWRHKILSAFEHIQPSQFSGIIESEEIYVEESHKGNRKKNRASGKRAKAPQRESKKNKIGIVATCDRKGNKELRVVGKGRMTESELKELLGNRIPEDSVLCTSEHGSYDVFAREEDIVHKPFKSDRKQRKAEQIYHILNAQNLHQRSKKFLKRFNGVSTKYLQNYLNWFLALEKLKNTRKRIRELDLILFTAADPVDNYIEICKRKYVY